MEIQWSLVLFTAISGVGAWLFAASMIQALAKRGSLPGKMETIASFVVVAVGGCMSVTHLKHVDRIFEALNHPTSGIFVEAAMVGVLCVLLAVYLVCLLRGSKEGVLKIVGAFALVVGVVYTFACGYSYMMEARQAWMTYALPLAYCLTCAVGGAAASQLLKALGRDGLASEGAAATRSVDAGAARAAGVTGSTTAKLRVDGTVVSFAGLVVLVVSVLALACSVAFFVHASGWLDDVRDGAVAWIAVTLVSAVVAGVCGAVAWRQPTKGAVAVAVMALIAGVVCAIALRLAMWLVGVPVMDLFLMPLD